MSRRDVWTAPDGSIASGPVTNIAALLRTGAQLPRLAIMGAKFEDFSMHGMELDAPEWNWRCDPVAAAETIAAEHVEPPLVIPAEVTFPTSLDPDDIAGFGSGHALAQALVPLSTEWMELLRTMGGLEHPYVALHDPLTAAVLVEPELCT